MLRFAGGMQALFALGWLGKAAAVLDESYGTPADAVGWGAYGLGAALVAAMALAGLRVGLGGDQIIVRAVRLLGVTLAVGVAGMVMMAVAAAD